VIKAERGMKIPDGHRLVVVSPQEWKLLELIENIEYGRVEGAITRINVQSGLPVSAEVTGPAPIEGLNATRQVRFDQK